MKLKASFDSKAAQGFLQQHMEKVMLGLAVVMLIFLAVTSFGKEKLDWLPDDLANTATNARDRIQSNEVIFDDVQRDYIKEVEDGLRITVGLTNYEHQGMWDSPIFEEKSARGEPAVFPVLDLRATAGQGPVNMLDEARSRTTRVLMPGEEETLDGFEAESDGNVEGQRWVVVTGLIPIKRQFESHMDALAGAKYSNQELDFPNYIMYEVLRHEVGQNDSQGEPVWSRVQTFKAAKAIFSHWSGEGTEVVAGQYFAGVPAGATPMASRLPPLAQGEFGEEVAHDPEIPLDAVEKERKWLEYMEAIRDDGEQIHDDLDVWLKEYNRNKKALAGGGGGGGGDEESGEEAYGGGGGGGGDWWTRTVRFIADEEESLEYQLFRFFDFSIDPNKSYQYKVKLHLLNPNYSVPEQYLEKPEFAKRNSLATEFSEPSGPVAVPQDSRLLLVTNTASPRAWSDGSGEVMGILFDMNTGLESVDTFPVRRGMVANFMDKILRLAGTPPEGMESDSYDEGEDEYGEEYEEDYGGEGEEGGSSVAYEQPEEEERVVIHKVDYVSDLLVGDLAGGRTLPGRRERGLTEPSSILLIAPDGSMTVQTQDSDLPNYLRYKDPDPIEE